MTSPSPAIVWFREDLRLADNPALTSAMESGRPILCVYILDEISEGVRPLGGASRWWLHHSLAALDSDLRGIGGRLDLFRGRAQPVLETLAEENEAASLAWTRRYDKAGVAIDTAIKAALGARLSVESFNGKLIVEPWTMKTRAGGPFRVFTPFWRAVLATQAPQAPLPAPRRIVAAPAPRGAVALDDLALLPTQPDWAGGLRAAWSPGEKAATKRLTDFLDERVSVYAETRDIPGVEGISMLSPHLAFGEISPRQIWTATRHAAAADPRLQRGCDKFLAEIGWREFSYGLLFAHPDLATKNFDPRFDRFVWNKPEPGILAAWREGRTGYPIVDAGMRELWSTGYMHNRVRMIVASFLVKHLLIDWRIGEDWFWDTLCDADAANNAASWQWVAGCGADAAPYFRVFNPVLQGEKFDADGAYVRRWLPELAGLPDRFTHKPWQAPTPPRNYPAPIVDHARARARALAAFQQLKD